MPLHYWLDASVGLVRAGASGTVTEHEVIDAIDAVAQETHGAALHRNVLTVLENGTLLDQFDTAALQRVHAHIKAWLKTYPGGGVKSAFVTDDLFNTGLLRLWQALVELYPTIGRHVGVFSNHADAVAWLNSPND